MRIEEEIKTYALNLGLNLCGISSAKALESDEQQRFAQWLACGYAADMDYMRRNRDKRTNAANLLDGAQSVVCTALAYNRVAIPENSQYIISSYACYEDYHKVIKNILFKLAEFIRQRMGADIKFKACVDSVPILERAYARLAGLGFIGKNRTLINPVYGSRIFLGELITTAALEPDRPIEGNCGDCSKCIDACPADAITETGIDCRKCISYHTIENRQEIPPQIAKLKGSRVFGCDSCVDACPYNALTPQQITITPIIPRGWSAEQIRGMDEDEFNRLFAQTPIHRRGLELFRKTCLNQ